MSYFVSDDSVTIEQVGPVYPSDICTMPRGVNFCGSHHKNNSIIAVDFVQDYLVVGYLEGSVRFFNVTDFSIVHEFNIEGGYGGINLPHEWGLTGITVDHEEIYLFLSYNFNTQSLPGAAIARYEISTQNITIIKSWNHIDIIANAHNLHGGITKSIYDTNVLIVSFGDLNNASYCHNPYVDFGKLLIMDYDGHTLNTTVFDTGHPNNLHLAYGNRNLFHMTCLDKDVDSKERCLWQENGNSYQRMVLTTLLQPGLALDLQWTGTDDTQWLNMNDAFYGNNAVLHFKNDESCVYLTTVNAGYGQIHFVESCMNTGKVTLRSIANLNVAPQPALASSSTELIHVEGTTATAPMATAWDGHRLIISDVFTGNIYSINTPLFLETPQLEFAWTPCEEKEVLSSLILAAVIAAMISALISTVTTACLCVHKTKKSKILKYLRVNSAV